MQDEKQTEAGINNQPHRGNTALISSLKPEEYNVYIWLLQTYSIRWISETLDIKTSKVRSLAAKIYKKLEVKNQRDLIRHYITPEKYKVEPFQNLENIAYSMALYTDQNAAREACQ